MNDVRNVPAKFATALERLDGKVSLLCEMAAITSEDLPQVKAKVESAFANGDCQQAATALHKLKGMLSTFDSDDVTLKIQEMLDATRRGQIDQARKVYHEHRREIEELTSEIAELATEASR